jgi:Cytochrome P460
MSTGRPKPTSGLFLLSIPRAAIPLPQWADGWGWALFKADALDKQVATDYKKDCLECHMPAKADDWIYITGYPVLHSN